MSDSRSNSFKKYAAVMLLGVGLNIGLYWIAHVFHLPMWLDTVGTAAAAVILEPAAGLLIGYATNLFEANAVYMSDSVVYYAITASCALIFGVMLRKKGKICWKRLPLAAVCYIVVAAVLSALISLWRGGVPGSGWELQIYGAAISAGLGRFLAFALSSGALKLADAAVICAVTPLLYRLLPDGMKNVEHFSGVTWKSPFKKIY